MGTQDKVVHKLSTLQWALLKGHEYTKDGVRMQEKKLQLRVQHGGMRMLVNARPKAGSVKKWQGNFFAARAGRTSPKLGILLRRGQFRSQQNRMSQEETKPSPKCWMDSGQEQVSQRARKSSYSIKTKNQIIGRTGAGMLAYGMRMPGSGLEIKEKQPRSDFLLLVEPAEDVSAQPQLLFLLERFCTINS